MGNQADFLGLLGLVRSVSIVTYDAGSSDFLRPVYLDLMTSHGVALCPKITSLLLRNAQWETKLTGCFKLVAFYRLKCIGKSMASNEQLHSKLAKNCDFS